MLAERLDLTVVSALCTIDNVLVEGSVDTAGVSTTEVNVHALGHCHNKDTVATILKKANPEDSVSMQTRLTHHKYGAPYGRSCRDGLFKSIYTKDGGQDSNSQSTKKVQAPITLLVCFCQLAGGFDTDVVFQDGGYLVDGDMRVERSGNEDIFDTHGFKNHGIGMCKEFRRCTVANCMSHGMRLCQRGVARSTSMAIEIRY